MSSSINGAQLMSEICCFTDYKFSPVVLWVLCFHSQFYLYNIKLVSMTARKIGLFIYINNAVINS